MRELFTRAAALALALVTVSATGCKGRDKGPDCKAVAASYATLQQKEIEKPYTAPSAEGTPGPTAAQQKEQALSLIPLLKEAMVKECEEKKWDVATRRCVVEAATPDDLERCHTQAEAIAPAETTAPAEPASPAAPAEKSTSP